MEIENDAGAEQRYRGARRRPERRLGAGTYAFIDTGVDRHRRDQGRADLQAGLGHAGRRVRRSSTTRRTRGSSTRGTGRRWPRRSSDNATGARLTVVVNHLKSKGSDCNESATRTPATARATATSPVRRPPKALVDWLATDPTGSGDPDVLVIGDINSYTFEDPIQDFDGGRLHEPRRASSAASTPTRTSSTASRATWTTRLAIGRSPPR